MSMLTVPGSIPITRGMGDGPSNAKCKMQNANAPRTKPRGVHTLFAFCILNSELLAKLPRNFGNRLRIQHQVVTLEEPRDAGLVNLHLQPADPERPENGHAVALHGIVG